MGSAIFAVKCRTFNLTSAVQSVGTLQMAQGLSGCRDFPSPLALCTTWMLLSVCSWESLRSRGRAELWFSCWVLQLGLCCRALVVKWSSCEEEQQSCSRGVAVHSLPQTP